MLSQRVAQFLSGWFLFAVAAVALIVLLATPRRRYENHHWAEAEVWLRGLLALLVIDRAVALLHVDGMLGYVAAIAALVLVLFFAVRAIRNIRAERNTTNQ